MASTTSTPTTVSPVTTNMTTLTNDTTSQVVGAGGGEGWMEASAPRIAFLAFFILFGFLGNLFLIITICSSHRFRATPFYMFSINLAVVNLCECVLNMSILLAASILNAWTFGDISCSMSVFFLSFICIETVLGLTVLTVDRLVAVRYRDKYDHVVSTPRISLVLAFTWFQSFSFSIPIAVGAVPTSVNNYTKCCNLATNSAKYRDKYDHVVSTPRISLVLAFTWFQSFSFSIPIAVGAVPTSVNNYTKCCNLATNSSMIYGVFASAFCFIVPLILMIIMFVKIIRTGYKERVMVRTLISQHSYKDEGTTEPRIKQELRHSNLTGTVCACWLVMHGPYIVTYYFNELKNSTELESSLSSDRLQYIWYVDLVLLWVRFSYVLVLPIATFTWNKDVWKSFKDIFLCRKNNSVEDESFKKSDADSLRLGHKLKIKDEDKAREKLKDPASQTPREQRVFQVPVLFATSHGVHIQTASQTNVFEDEIGDGNKKTMRGKKCDVEGSRENLNFEEDTSDYDSANEMDPFSVSNPVSVRQLESTGLTDRHRSISNPEVRESAEAEDKPANTTVGSTTAGDSGLDLSSGTPLHKVCNSKTAEERGTKENLKDVMVKPVANAIGIIDEDESINTVHGDTDDKKHNVIKHNHERDSESHSVTENAGTSVDAADDNVSSGAAVKMKKKLNSGTLNSPAQRRKKKKRKEKNVDNLSNASDLSCTTLPLRPPPRLAPIMSGGGAGKAFQTARPGSSCSSQVSYAELSGDASSQFPANHEKCLECGKNDSGSCDNLSVASFSLCRNLNNTHNTVLKQVGASLDNHESQNEKRQIRSVPEEPLPGCENDSFRNEKSDECEQGANTVTLVQATDSDADAGPSKTCRNAEARRKRRERLSTNSLLNDGKGYKRLLPETP